MADHTTPYDWDRLTSYPSNPALLPAYFEDEADGRRFIADCGGNSEDWSDASDIVFELTTLRIPADRQQFLKARAHAVAAIRHSRAGHRVEAWREGFHSLTQVPVPYIRALLEEKEHAVSNWQKVEMTVGIYRTGVPAEYARKLPWHQDYGVARGYTVPAIQRLYRDGVSPEYARAVADSGATIAEISEAYATDIAPEYVIGRIS